MLLDALDAATAGVEVGYESANQFNREYSRFFANRRCGIRPPTRQALRQWGLSNETDLSSVTAGTKSLPLDRRFKLLK
jgi:hypothetical protein